MLALHATLSGGLRLSLRLADVLSGARLGTTRLYCLEAAGGLLCCVGAESRSRGSACHPWQDGQRGEEGERERERGAGKKRERCHSKHSFRMSSSSSLLQDSWQSQRGRLEEKKKKEKSWRKGGEGGVWRLGEELAANFAISVKQNAEGKWESRGGEAEERGYGDL